MTSMPFGEAVAVGLASLSIAVAGLLTMFGARWLALRMLAVGMVLAIATGVAPQMLP